MKQFSIGNVLIPGQVVLGPMAGVTDLPFRLIAREQGCSLAVMEMISAKAVTFGNRRTKELALTVPEDRPVSLQLFGSDPAVMAEAAERIADWPFDILDVNMGCPVPKVVNNGEGSALMKDPERIEQIVAALVRHTDRPVTVKIRRGYDLQHLNAVECAKAAEAGGASAIAVHGRTRTQMYSGHADWSIIRDVVSAVRIPVIGNGDVTDGPSAVRMLDETGCAAVMVARAARGNPWIFREISHYLETGQETARPGRRDVARMIQHHAKLMLQYKGEQQGILEMRKHVAWYVQGFPGASRLRARVNTVTSFRELDELLEREFPYT